MPMYIKAFCATTSVTIPFTTTTVSKEVIAIVVVAMDLTGILCFILFLGCMEYFEVLEEKEIEAAILTA